MEFLKKEMGYVQEKKVIKIESLSEYEFIIEDNLQEFFIFYSKQFNTRLDSFMVDFMQEKLTDEYSIYAFYYGNPLNQKEAPNIAYECVNALNEEIFNLNIKKIKQMMSVAIMETQALLETIDVNSCKPRTD